MRRYPWTARPADPPRRSPDPGATRGESGAGTGQDGASAQRGTRWASQKEAAMFTVEEREQVQAWLVEQARSDPRVTSGALIGSLATTGADQWSDIDLTFGVAAGVRPAALLDDWTAAVQQEWGLVHHWDLPFRTSLYRVFLLPSGLEADVSVTPAPDFGARGPRFRLLFGATQAGEPTSPPAAQDLIGRGWHHVLHAHSALERGQPCQRGTRNAERGTEFRSRPASLVTSHFRVPRSYNDY